MSFCSRVSSLVATVAVSAGALLCRQAVATNVGGPIFTNTTWTTAGSPYIVTSSIIIGANATLTVQPGVIVKFNSGLSMTVGSVSFGAGTLKAQGTSGQPILFTANSANPAPGQWKDVFFTNYAVDATFNANNLYTAGSVLQYCVIEYAGGGTSGAINISESSPLIQTSEVRYSQSHGLYASNSAVPLPPSLQVRDSNFHHNAGGASLNGTAGWTFDSNLVHHNSATGLTSNATGNGHSTTVSGCEFSSNVGGGIKANFSGYNAIAYISGNTASDNTNGSGMDVSAIGDYWGGPSNSLVTLSSNLVERNTNSGNDGGGIRIYAIQAYPVVLTNNVVKDNVARQGGGVYLLGYGSSNYAQTISLTGNVIASNEARAFGGSDGKGGGIFIEGSHQGPGSFHTLTSNVIAENLAAGGFAGGSGLGGGIWIGSNTQPMSVTLAGNQSSGTYNVFSQNSADLGGAIYNNRSFVKNGSNDVHAEYVCWGGLDPNPTIDENLIFDFFDNPQKAFVVYPPHVTGALCPGTSGCAPGEILDCNGNCAPASWLGDAICDDGTYIYEGNAISFDCPKFNNDNGDCDPPQDPFTNPPNQGEPESAPYDDDALDEISKADTSNIVVVVHGFNTDEAAFFTTWVPFKNELATNYTAPGTWKFQAYNWTADCGRLTPLNFLTPLATASAAASEGFGHGLVLGKTIANGGYSHVHLIGHSAGSAVIAAAAKAIRLEATALGVPQPKIHCTFLDAFVPPGEYFGGMDALQLYGTDADFADQYFVKSALHDLTGSATSQLLPHALNVDVTTAVGDYACGSSLIEQALCGHSWPIQLYRGTVTKAYDCDDGPTPMLHDLSKEHFTGPGDWFAFASSLPQGSPALVLSGLDCQGGMAGDGSGSEGSDLVPFVRNDPPLNLSVLEANVSSIAAVTVSSSSVSLNTEPSADQAWVNFQLNTKQKVNQVSLTVDFASAGSSVGLLSAYMDGKRIGRADEPNYLIDGTPVVFFMAEDAVPGLHVLSFRLDDQGPGGSTVQVSDIATGYGAYVPLGDLTGDGIVNGADLGALLGEWGPAGPGDAADFNQDGIVNGADLGIILGAWTAN